MTSMETVLLASTAAYAAGCVYLNGQRLKWRSEARRWKREALR